MLYSCVFQQISDMSYLKKYLRAKKVVMKKGILIVLELVIVFSNVSFGQINQEVPIIKGTIFCYEPQWAILTLWADNIIDLDSVYLNKGNNQVQFKGIKAVPNVEECYTLSFKKRQIWLYLTNEKVTIMLDLKETTKLPFFDVDNSILNSPATSESYHFVAEYYKLFISDIDIINKKLDSLKYELPGSEEINVLNQKIRILNEGKEIYLIKKILTLRFGCNVMQAFVWLTNNKYDLSPYVYLADSVEKRFPKSIYIKNDMTNFRRNAKTFQNAATEGSAPKLELSSDKNQMIKLSDYKGKYVFLDFWASWCSACLKEMPNVIEIQKRYQQKGLKIISISTDKKRDAWLKAIEKYSMHDLINVHDEKGETAKAYHVSYVPLTVLINPKGEIIGTNLHGEDLEKKLEQVLKNQ